MREPSAVHEHDMWPRGHRPAWVRRTYDGGAYRTDHYRICSYCGCIHPGDLAELIRRGGVAVEGTGKSYKRYFMIPNPIHGRMVQIGSRSGPIVHVGGTPSGLVARLVAPIDRVASGIPDEHTVGLLQRLRGTWKAPIMGLAPRWIQQKFYMNHVNRGEWEAMVAPLRSAVG